MLVSHNVIIDYSADKGETNLWALRRKLNRRWGKLEWELASIPLVPHDATQLGGDHLVVIS
jgi:hypothetical protein